MSILLEGIFTLSDIKKTGITPLNQVIWGDHLEVMPYIEDKSVDMILCDLPYAMTGCKWDILVDLEKLWVQYKRIIKDNGAIVLTGIQPFTSKLIMSNLKWFKCSWIWEKNKGSNFGAVKYHPMREHEDVLVFGKNTVLYNPIMQERSAGGKARAKYVINLKDECSWEGHVFKHKKKTHIFTELRYPRSIQKFNCEMGKHPTQKPTSLFEYMIKTYSNEGMTILDNCAGSFTTSIACENLNRNWICIEKELKYCEIGLNRILENRHSK